MDPGHRRLHLVRHVGFGGRRDRTSDPHRGSAAGQLHQRGRRRRPQPVPAQRDGTVAPQRVDPDMGPGRRRRSDIASPPRRPPPPWRRRSPVFDPNDPRFLPPGDIPSRVEALCREQGLAVPSGRPEMVRSILESLAHAFADAVRDGGRPEREVGDAPCTSSAVVRSTNCCASSRRIAPGCTVDRRSGRGDRDRATCSCRRAPAACCRATSTRYELWSRTASAVTDVIGPPRSGELDETTHTQASRLRRSAAVPATTAERHGAPVGAGADDRRPARDRPTGDAQGALRLHRRCRRGRAVVGQGAAGVRGRRVPPRDPARRSQRSTRRAW